MIAGLLLIVAAPAYAEDRDYCPQRPGLGTPACTMAPGNVSVETALADWTLDQDADQRTDTILIGDTLVRVGLADAIELQLGFTPFGHVRTRDKVAGDIDSANRVGDASIGFKVNLSNPDGSGFSAALLPFATLPVGRTPVGAGDWGAGLLVPVTYDLSDALNLESTSEIDAAVNEGGHGRHVAFSETVGLGFALTKSLTATAELQALRDDDPSGATTQMLAGLSLACMLGKNMQIDAGANAGLNHYAPDVELYLGVSRRF
ncbi:transporter [Sphingomonas sp. GB1N7]|uniref:transporter n=1 Tax=Parasphingomonas caseinilytica TaxID=3096158 RepID=UPI002FCCB245